MSVETDPLPLVPIATKPVNLGEGPLKGQLDSAWGLWFEYLKIKVDLINSTVQTLSSIVGSGIVSVDANGNAIVVSLIGTTNRLTLTTDTSVTPNTITFNTVGGRIVEQGSAVLVAGTKVVSSANVSASSKVFLTVQTLGTVTVPKACAVTGTNVGASFTITSADATDTSTIAWMIVETT